jgi:hypothetical protein
MTAAPDGPSVNAAPSPPFASVLARSAPSLSTGASRSFFDGDPLGQALPPNMKGVRGNRVLLGLVRPFSPPELFALLIILLLRGILTAHHN